MEAGLQLHEDCVPTSVWDKCPEEAGWFDITLGSILLIGTLISFLPQHIRLIMRKSHVGLSLERVLLGAATGSASVTYFIAMKTCDIFLCCENPLACYYNSLSFGGVLVALLCDMGILFLYLYYFDHEWLEKHHHYEHHEYNAAQLWRRAKILSSLFFFYQAVIFSTLIYMILGAGINSEQITTFGFVFIGVTACGQIVQWVPQILETHRLKHVGSVSIPMVLLQAVGSLLTAIFNGLEDAWYIWAPFVVSFIFATILSCQVLYYWNKDRKEHHVDILQDSADGESGPLLINKENKENY